jgi:sec-independent protein translocase protein TatC
VVAAVITPPDALTQIMLAIPLMLLYEISIIMSKIVLKRRKKKELEKYV